MDIPIFDFSGMPILAIVQFALVIALPILVGLVTDRLSAGWVKVALLGGLTFVATILTAILAAGGLDGVDWPNVVGNALVTWFLAIAAHLGILKPLGVTAKAQESNVVQFIPKSAKRVAAEEQGYPVAS